MPNRIISYHPALKMLARRLRQEGTFAEISLWKRIQRKALGVEFHRQLPIDNFNVDFYCHELFLAIEIDCGSHKDEVVSTRDASRQARLEGLGVRFIRFTESDVRQKMDEVLMKLQAMIEHLQQQR